MKNELSKIVKSFSNNVLAIGINEDITKIIKDNDNILNCDILTNDSSKKERKKRKLFSEEKSININKIRKRYKKKSVDYIICDYDVIKPYMKNFVKNSVYINKNKLYFYGNVDIDFIKTRYGRYKTKINIKEYKKYSIVEIDNTNSKNNFIKELLYFIKDSIVSLIEIIGDILMG